MGVAPVQAVPVADPRFGAPAQPPFGQVPGHPPRRTARAPAVSGPGLAPTGAMQSPMAGGVSAPPGGAVPEGFNRQRTVIVPADQVGQGPRTGPVRRRRPATRRPAPAPTIAAHTEGRPWLDRERIIIGAILLLVVVGTGIATTLLVDRGGQDDGEQPTVIEAAEGPTPTPQPAAPPEPPAPTTATLVLRAEPEDAQVQIDGKWVVHDTASTQYDVKAGEPVKVLVKADGFAPYETTLTLEAGVRHPLDVRLDRLTGTLVVETRPSGATIFVDGKEKGTSPLTLEKLPLDRDTALRVEKAGYQPQTRDVEWEGDTREQTLELALEAKPTPKPRRTRRARRRPSRSRSRARPSGGGGSGFLSVTSRQWGSVFLNRGQIAMETPLIKYKVPAGKHRVHVCYAGDRSRCTPSKTVTVRDGKTSVVKF